VRQLLPVLARHVLDLRELQPNAGMAEKMWGHAPAGIYGYSALTGGYAGGQAEYARVPFADVGPIKIENDDLTDDQVLFLSDIFPTGYMGAEVCEIQPGDVIAVWGAGPVGLFAIASARMLGAERVIAIDRFHYGARSRVTATMTVTRRLSGRRQGSSGAWLARSRPGGAGHLPGFARSNRGGTPRCSHHSSSGTAGSSRITRSSHDASR
jgi:hypothetical protein